MGCLLTKSVWSDAEFERLSGILGRFDNKKRG